MKIYFSACRFLDAERGFKARRFHTLCDFTQIAARNANRICELPLRDGGLLQVF